MAGFDQALRAIDVGNRVARSGWNGKGMFLFRVEGHDYELHNVPVQALGRVKQPWICMATADNGLVPWLASQADLLADDWQVV